MPTGYTAEISEGKKVSGKEFLMKCARAFGACIEMRDANLNEPIPDDFKPSTYYQEQTKRVEEELVKYQSLSTEEIQELIDAEYNKTIKYNKEQIKKHNEIKDNYQHILDEVNAWQPPTSDHVNLKDFAINQLEESMKWDCDTSYYEKEVIKLTPKEWLIDKIIKCQKDLKYYKQENEKEIQRVADRNKWIKDLRESLN